MKSTTKFSYLHYMNRFWQVNKTANFSSTDIALYFYLLDINNSCQWKHSFNHNNKAIEATLSISFKTLAKSREKLHKVGLINFQTKHGSPNVSYQIIPLSQSYGNFPKVSGNEVDDIIKKEKRVNIIKKDTVDFDSYKKYLKSKDSLEKVESIYKLYKLKVGSLEKLANEFEIYQMAVGNNLKSSIVDHHIHFLNWLNKQELLGKLNRFKSSTIKSIGSL